MWALRIARHGGPEVIERVEVPDESPGSERVAVRVTHVGLNHLDVWVRRGVGGHKFPLPLIPGSDMAGVREDTGESVVVFPAEVDAEDAPSLAGRPDLSRTYRIRGEGVDGGCRERVWVKPRDLFPAGTVPREQAASLPLSLLTAWHMLIGRARIEPGQRVLVQGGAGGVGALAIQVARAAGARVVATASTPEKRALCLELGAEAAWDYDHAADGVRGWAGRDGVDVVVDHAGLPSWDLSLRLARWGGTVVTCGATGGHEVPLNLRVLFFKQLSLLGSTMGSHHELRRAWELVLAGRIRPTVDVVLPMSRLGEAHALLETRRVRGKVVVEQDLGR
jgi:NADPH:quinone reductase-like Zn-dependent oxidoreductase